MVPPWFRLGSVFLNFWRYSFCFVLMCFALFCFVVLVLLRFAWFCMDRPFLAPALRSGRNSGQASLYKTKRKAQGLWDLPWAHPGSALVPPWFHHGSTMVPPWLRFFEFLGILVFLCFAVLCIVLLCFLHFALFSLVLHGSSFSRAHHVAFGAEFG